MKGVIFIAFLFVSVLFSAQTKHVVQAKETLYGLSKKYNVSQQDILKANPTIAEKGLQIGDELTIPNQGNTQTPITPTKPVAPPADFDDKNYQYITIAPKETLYNLSKQYGISIESLKSINPSLSEGLKEGDVIRIPKKGKINPEGYHQVSEGETLYSISRKYSLSIEEILLANRDLQVDNMQIGQYLKIPGRGQLGNFTQEEETTIPPNGTEEVKNPVITEVENGKSTYTVKKGETVFTLLNKFDISLEEFVKANPDVQSSIEPGDRVNIPLKSQSKFDKVEQFREKDDTVRVAIFLPFFLEDESKKGQKEVSTYFLSGAKMALDSLITKGKKLEVEVVDSGDREIFKKTLETAKIYNADLYIGPFYKDNIFALREKTNHSGIPIVSPLVKNAELLNEKNIIFAEVDDETFAKRIEEEVVKVAQDQKIILITDSRKMPLTIEMSKNFTARGKSVEVISNIEDFKQEQNLVTEEYQAIIPILVSEDESLGKSFIEKIDEMDDNSVSPYSVFYLNSFDKTSNIQKLRKKGFVYVTNRKVDTNGWDEKKTLKKYEAEYCQSPHKYAVIGFDIVYDLLNRMDEDKNIINHLDASTSQLATKFKYQKLPSGSYENVGVRVIRYTKFQ